VVRDLGDWRVAWPEGVAAVHDLPWTFIEAWSFATVILSWYENVSPEDMPPRHIWQSSDDLRKHWAYITKRREDNSRHGEAPEGTLEDAGYGDVTLRNKLVTDFLDVTNPVRAFDNFSEI